LKIVKECKLGSQVLKIETGNIAKQADGSVLVSIGDTIVMVTVVFKKEVNPEQDFFPLTVDYQEKFYAGGRIPGGFFKREGRPSEKEILTCRLIDRPLRPLFPKGFFNDVQIIVNTLSIDPEISPDIPAIIGASAAVSISGLPFDVPVGASRIGIIDNDLVLNPTKSQLENSTLDLVIAGTSDAILMVESGANELSEEKMLEALVFGHESFKPVIELINELKKEVSIEKYELPVIENSLELPADLKSTFESKISEAYAEANKKIRNANLKNLFIEFDHKVKELIDDIGDTNLHKIFHDIESQIVRSKVLNGERRIDGRDTLTVRDITIESGFLPRVHGSALFTRGETQAIVATTLGTSRDEQMIDSVEGEYSDSFMLHYNFPPFSTGETGRVGTPKRREIGHGRLAKRALMPVLPSKDDFAYTIRIVSEITESNGSSSMASVCGGCLSMLDAGVPLKNHVAGVAMGLVKDGNKFAILTDILGDEDHLGDMDFKVAGTENGITALQMDIKIAGINKEILSVALDQAKEGRMHILKKMKEALPAKRADVSDFAPRMIKLSIKPEKIRDVIGKGGSVIKKLIEDTGAQIDITDDGSVTISSVSLNSAQLAKSKIEEITADVEVGKIYDGKVNKLLDFGAIVSILPGRDGLLHISQIAEERVENVSDYLKEGQSVTVKVIETDDKGRIRLSMKALN